MPRVQAGPPATRTHLDRMLKKVNGGIALERKLLEHLLAERIPSTICRDRSEYRFDPFILRELAALLPPVLRQRTRLPLLFFVDLDDGERCFILSTDTLAVLLAVGLLQGQREVIDKRLYLERSVADAFIARFPGLGQVAVAAPATT